MLVDISLRGTSQKEREKEGGSLPGPTPFAPATQATLITMTLNIIVYCCWEKHRKNPLNLEKRGGGGLLQPKTGAHYQGNYESRKLEPPRTVKRISPKGFTQKSRGHFRVPKSLTFKMRPSAQLFLWKCVLLAWEWKIISISMAEYLTWFWYWGAEELGNFVLLNSLVIVAL